MISNKFDRCSTREACYVAILSAFQEQGFISDILEQWKKQANPSSLDYRFAQELSYGTVRMALSLDYLAAQLTDKKKLSLKLKERVLLRMAFYQFFFMTKVPLYAIADQTVALARKYCHSSFVGFLNAILRQLSDAKPELPQGDRLADLSIRYSYPEYYVQQLLNDYSLDTVKSILQAGNEPATTMVRVRSQKPQTETDTCLEIISSLPCVGILKESSALARIAQSTEYYIQNITPAALMARLSERWNRAAPENILDLCASPGGKLLAAHDYFPEAHLFANDVSQDKILTLSENCAKYGIEAQISCSKGEEYVHAGQFDIIILDAPCSNTGVLNKRPEARWRIKEENLQKLESTQAALLKKARTLISAKGEIWYLTCSILKRENEFMMEKAARELNLSVKWQESILPDSSGRDGGFACSLSC